MFSKDDQDQLEMELIRRIQRMSIQAGSRAWGGVSEKSDWDYFIEDKEYRKLKNSFNVHVAHRETGEEYSTRSPIYNLANVYITLCGESYNLIVYADEHMESLKKVNDFMLSMRSIKLGARLLRVKENRIKFFRAALHLFFDEKDEHLPEI